MARAKYSILTLDGGGIRGVIPARAVHELETRLGRPASELFDMVSGTSTGGLIALGLAVPGQGGAPAYRASDLLSLYVDHGRELFPHSFLRTIESGAGLLHDRYPAGPLEALVRNRFGERMLSEAIVEVVVPSYDLARPGPFFFKRRYAASDPALDIKMWQTARATSAAPTFFEPLVLPAFPGEASDHILVDGGTYANNPAVAAYAEGIQLWGPEAEIHVISIGTGAPPPRPGAGPIPVSDAARVSRWGLAEWAHPLLEAVFDGVAKATEWQMQRLCNTAENLRYQRLQSPLPTATHALDDASPENLQRLLADAETMLHESAATLDTICERLEAVAADRAAESPAPA